jgi:hypothetical protein
LRNVNGDAFANSRLSITVDKDCLHLELWRDFLADLTELALVRYFGLDVEITTSDAIRQIDGACFLGCSFIQSATFEPESPLSVIDDRTFQHCASLTGVTIVESVETIGADAFRGCDRLSIVQIEGRVVCLSSVTVPFEAVQLSPRSAFLDRLAVLNRAASGIATRWRQ